MLIPNQYFDIKIIKTNIEHYRSLGYDVKLRDIIAVPAEHLKKGSHQDVNVICDCCGEEFSRVYKTYVLSTQNGYDYCKKCSQSVKNRRTLLERYGTDNIMKVPGAKEKLKQTNLDRYGVENYAQTEECKQKIRETCLQKYGFISILSSPEFRDKITNIIQEKYGVENVNQLDFVKERKRQTCLERYGVEYVSQLQEVKEKIKVCGCENRA